MYMAAPLQHNRESIVSGRYCGAMHSSVPMAAPRPWGGVEEHVVREACTMQLLAIRSEIAFKLTIIYSDR